MTLGFSVRCVRGKGAVRGGRHPRLREEQVRRVIILLAAMASIWLLGTLGTDDRLFRENQRADAQTTRPNFVFVMTNDLDERSMDDLMHLQTSG